MSEEPVPEQTPEELISRLRKAEIFASTPADLLETLSQAAKSLTFGADEVIFKENSPSVCLYVIVRGSVEIYKTTRGTDVLLATLHEGASLGEMGLMDDAPRSANARASGDGTELISVPKDLFIDLLRQNPEVLLSEVQTISKRLRSGNEELQYRFAELVMARQQVEKSYTDTMLALSHALESRDRATEGHCRRVTTYSAIIGEHMNLDKHQMRALKLGAMLHDLGKIGIPDAVLNKKTKLTDEEWELMRKHPEWGRNFIAHIPFLKSAIDVVYSHHERWDGKGYPLGLKEQDIPLNARIFSVADVFDALTMERSYKDAWTANAARNEIRAHSGTQFDPKVIGSFLERFEQIAEALELAKTGKLRDVEF